MAPKFHFPLARLLRVKEIEEKAAQARYSEADLAARAKEESASRRTTEALEAQAQLLRGLRARERLHIDFRRQRVSGELDHAGADVLRKDAFE